MSKKAVLFGVVLLGSGLALLLEHGPFLVDDDISLQPSPDTIDTPPMISTVPQSTDELPDEAGELEPTIGAETKGLFSSVEWRNRGNLSHDEYPQTYAELRTLAEEGDVEATRRLTALLRSCSRAAIPMSEAELSEIVAEMRATYSYPMLRDGKFEFLPSATGELSHKMSPAEFDSFIDQWHSNVMSCNAVTVAQREEADFWFGVLEAQSGVPAFSHETFQGMDRDMKIAYVENIWAMGDPYALAKYAEIYGDHELQLIDPSARVKSYAYIYAFYEALIETAKQSSDADGIARLQNGLRHIRTTHERILSEHELKEAYELARKTIAENENCCVRLPPTLYR